jgi:hypothetical protein
MSVVEGREYTLSIAEVVSLIASKAVSVDVVGGALIRNGHTNFISVEEPGIGAF